jgi:hypothetical protein
MVSVLVSTVVDRGFIGGVMVSVLVNKTELYDITEILLKVALSTITL